MKPSNKIKCEFHSNIDSTINPLAPIDIQVCNYPRGCSTIDIHVCRVARRLKKRAILQLSINSSRCLPPESAVAVLQ